VNLATLFELARPRSATDRSRFRLLVVTIAIAGAFLLAAWRIKRLGYRGYYYSNQYSDYIQEDGIRTGVAFAAVLLAASSCLLAFQALKLGTTARDRRLAAFRLAGATPGQVRKLGAVDAGIAGLAGGILAGPLYFLLTQGIQALPRRARMLPPPNSVDLATWPIVAVVLAVAAAAVGALLGRGVISEPHERPANTPNVNRAAVACAVGLGFLLLSHLLGDFAVIVVPLGLALVIICLALPTLLIAWQGKRLERSRNPLKVLAGGRLLRTGRAHGRALALLVLCGSAVGFVVSMSVDLFRMRDDGYDAGFHVPGLFFAAGAAVFTAVIASVALLAGTADNLLDQRRQLAALNVLGVGEAQLRRSVRYQLTSSIASAVVSGLLIGGLLYADLMGRDDYSPDPAVGLLVTIGAAFVGGAVAWVAAVLASVLLRGHVHEATAAENLRST
jgi:hypothetical protein